MADEQRLGASFSIDVTQLKAGLAQANRLIRESESQFKAAAAEMDDWQSSSKGVSARLDHLNNATDLQRKKIAALNEQYQKLIDKGHKPTEKQMIETRIQINKETEALEKNKKEIERQTKVLEELGDESSKTSKDIGKVEDATEKSGKSLKSLKTAAAVGAAAIAAVGAAAVAGVKSLLDLAESTREYREDLNKLQTGFQTAGFSAEEATKVYKDFYAVLGEEDRSVEAVNHLAQLCDTQEDLNKWTDIATGVWATFGDSLPIEGLTEAANETAKVGDLTGVLADALNWAGINEDDFQKKLDACNNESERAQLITETLNELYADSADKYRELNKEIMDANYAQSEMADSMAELGAAAEPLNTQLEELKATILTGLTPALKDLLGALSEVLNGTEGGIENLSTSIDTLVTTILEKTNEALPKIIEVASNIIFTIAETLIEQLPSIMESAIQILNTLIRTLAENLPTLIPTIVDSVVLMAETLIDNIDLIIDAGIELILGLADGLIEAVPRLIDKVPIIIQKLLDAIISNLPKLVSAGIELISKLGTGMMQAIPELVSNIPSIISSIVSTLINEGIPALFDAGKQLINGLWEGIKSTMGWLGDQIGSFGNWVVDGFKKVFNIHSPSRVMKDEVGKFLGQGIALGLEDGYADKIKNVSRSIVRSLKNPIDVSSNNSAPVANAPSGVVINQYNTYSQPHTRWELYKSKQQTAAAVRLALGGGN